MKAIYKFHFDLGRSGDLTGIFVADTEQIDYLIISGLQVYFGEVAGKHSEVYGPIEQQDITMVTTDIQAVDMFEKYKLTTGHNPLDYTLLNPAEEFQDMAVREVISKVKG